MGYIGQQRKIGLKGQFLSCVALCLNRSSNSGKRNQLMFLRFLFQKLDYLSTVWVGLFFPHSFLMFRFHNLQCSSSFQIVHSSSAQHWANVLSSQNTINPESWVESQEAQSIEFPRWSNAGVEAARSLASSLLAGAKGKLSIPVQLRVRNFARRISWNQVQIRLSSVTGSIQILFMMDYIYFSVEFGPML